ncbi:MAG: inositol monophosphatase [Capsulimonadales bacterium]|nr:inositol monophosphatase [Capsulimonadales bacterium]
MDNLLNGEYGRVAVDLAREAGSLAVAAFTLGMRREWKEDGSPVTQTDLAVNQRVIEEIARRFPTHGVLGEEISALTPDQEWIWIVDPIDGTLPFSHGIPVSAFSLALTFRGESLLGVIYDYHSDRLLTAARGEGAFLNGRPIRVSSKSTMKGGVANLEAVWNRVFPTPEIAHLPALLESEGMKIMKLSSTVYAGMLVALGEFTALVTRGDRAWDVAAIDILVREAGGTVTDLLGAPLRYDRPFSGTVATNGPIHDRLLELIGPRTKEEGSNV